MDEIIEKVRIGKNLYKIGGGDAMNIIAPEYSESEIYSAGDYCIYQGDLYVCMRKTDGEFDSSMWAEVTNLQGLFSFNNTIQTARDCSREGYYRVEYPVLETGVTKLFLAGHGAMVFVNKQNLPDGVYYEICANDWNAEYYTNRYLESVTPPMTIIPEFYENYRYDRKKPSTEELVCAFWILFYKEDHSALTSTEINYINEATYIYLADSSPYSTHNDFYSHIASEFTKPVKAPGESATYTVNPHDEWVAYTDPYEVGDNGLFVHFWIAAAADSSHSCPRGLSTYELSNLSDVLWKIDARAYDEDGNFYYVGKELQAPGFGEWLNEPMRFVPKYIYAKYYYDSSILMKLEIKDIIISFMMSDRSYWDTNMNETIDLALAIYEKETQPTGTAVVRSLAKNDPEAVRQFLGILEEWKKFYPSYEMYLAGIASPPPIGGETFIDNLSASIDNPYASGIDCASVMLAALNGLLPVDVFDYSYEYTDEAIELKSKYPWAENLLRWQNTQFANTAIYASVGETRLAVTPPTPTISEVREPYQIAELMYQRGKMVLEWDASDMETWDEGITMTDALAAQGVSPEDIQPGDIVFFAEKYDGDYVEQYGFKHISHMAVVVDSGGRYDEEANYVWSHMIFQVISQLEAEYNVQVVGEAKGDTGGEIINYQCEPFQIESLWYSGGIGFRYSQNDYAFASGNTMVLVCRPSLNVTSNWDNIENEAQRIGLHVIPKDRNTLNIIKRARQFTDVKWTPAVDTDRYSAKYFDDSESNFVYYDTQFTAGTEYTGVPLFAYQQEGRAASVLHHVGADCGLDAFVSGIEAESSGTLTYGCSPEDFVGYVYETSVDFEHHHDGFESEYDPGIDELLGSMVTIVGYGVAVVTDLIYPKDADQWGYPRHIYGDSLVELCVASYYAGIGPGAIISSAVNGTVGGTVRRVTMTIDEYYSLIDWGEE